jgi:hypothetical protein
VDECLLRTARVHTARARVCATHLSRLLRSCVSVGGRSGVSGVNESSLCSNTAACSLNDTVLRRTFVFCVLLSYIFCLRVRREVSVIIVLSLISARTDTFWHPVCKVKCRLNDLLSLDLVARGKG